MEEVTFVEFLFRRFSFSFLMHRAEVPTSAYKAAYGILNVRTLSLRRVGFYH